MDRHPRIDRVIGPAEFLQRRDIAGGHVKLGKGMHLAGEGQAVEQEQPGLGDLLSFRWRNPIGLYGTVSARSMANSTPIGAGVGLDTEIILNVEQLKTRMTHSCEDLFGSLHIIDMPVLRLQFSCQYFRPSKPNRPALDIDQQPRTPKHR